MSEALACEYILYSDALGWVARARADERERIAQAIETTPMRAEGYVNLIWIQTAAMIARDGGPDE